MKIVSTVITHIGYLLLAAISASFLHTPTFSRVILLLMVPLNAVSEVKQGKSLGFLAMTLFIVLTIFANWIVAWTWYLLYKHQRNKITSQKAIGAPLSPITPNGCASTPIKGESGSPLKLPEGLTTPHVRTLISLLEQMCDQDSKVLSGSPNLSQKMAASKTDPSSTVKINPGIPMMKEDESLLNSSVLGTSVSKIDTSLITPDSPSDEDKKASVELVRRHLLNTLETTPSRGSSVSRRSSRPSSRASTPNRSSSRPLCAGITKTGASCRLSCMEGSNFCYRHKE